MLRRAAPILLALATAVLLASYIAHTVGLITELRAHSRQSSVLYARIYAALSDSSSTADKDAGLTTMLELSRQIMQMGVPVVITDLTGMPQTCINLPVCDPLEPERAREYASRFDRESPPVAVAGDRLVHFGFPTILRALQIVPFVQAGALLLLVAAGFIVLRTRNRSTRERVWAGMARESAHQIGTPLSSMNGWLELLSEPADEARRQQALSHMRSDIERLERVAHRFERIGRPPRKEPVDMVGIARAVTDYFRARVPTLAKRVIIQFAAPDDPAMVQGDRVLLEWAVEAVVRNAIDALADREGTVRVTVENLAEQGVRVRVADSGPGVKRELRSRIFQPGFTTKEHGWGVGLSLSRRIVEENHGGSIAVVPDDSGAIFDIVLP